MNAYAEQHQADNTSITYTCAFRRFCEWCKERGLEALPCEEKTMADYLAHLADKGRSASTISVTRVAIDNAHKFAGVNPPGRSLLVQQTAKGIYRAIGTNKKQKSGITAEVFAKMLRRAQPLPQHFETVVIVAVMRDAMLRWSELAALRVSDFTPMSDGTARLTIRRSKTDQLGEGAVQFLSNETAAMVVRHLLLTNRDKGFLFGYKTRPIGLKDLSRRIKRLAFIAGYDPTSFATHSPRIGMTQDLVAAGQSSVSVAQAGRWKTTKQVVNYSRNQVAAKGAVAKYYAHTQGAT